MKKLIYLAAAAVFTLSASSCSNYSVEGEKFLTKGFGDNPSSALELLSSSLSESDKKDFGESLTDLRKYLPAAPLKFKYRSGYTYTVMGSDYAMGYYSVNDDKKTILYVDFNDEEGKWIVSNCGILEPKDLLDDYLSSVEKLISKKAKGDKEAIASAEKDRKEAAKIIASFKEFFPDSEWEKYKNAKF